MEQRIRVTNRETMLTLIKRKQGLGMWLKW
jgi:hypothetical protein